MTHDDEGRMHKVWSFFLIESEADTPLTQIKTGDILKKGPRPLSTVGFCTLVPWTGACRYCNNEQKCRWISAACPLQRVKTRNHQPNKLLSLCQTQWYLGWVNTTWGLTWAKLLIQGDRQQWVSCQHRAERSQHPAKSCKPLTQCPEMHLRCWNVWSVRKQDTNSGTHGLDHRLQLLHPS